MVNFVNVGQQVWLVYLPLHIVRCEPFVVHCVVVLRKLDLDFVLVASADQSRQRVFLLQVGFVQDMMRRILTAVPNRGPVITFSVADYLLLPKVVK